MDFNRKIKKYILKWKSCDDRKPLIIRGARQVGKSTLVRQVGKTYKQYIELNLEKKKHKELFENIEELSDLVNMIFLQANKSLDIRPTLLFIDEIQESPKAIRQLRYFYEEFPNIHVIAAGSLLEFALKKVPSFPVGRVEQIVLHPFDFEEFLEATGNNQALKEIHKIPINKYAYKILLDLFHQYAVIGGMPEAIKKYVKDKHYGNLAVIYDNLWLSYKNDAEKYANNSSESRVIRHVINTAHAEKDRINFVGFGNSNYRSREVGEALRALDLAKIIQLIYPTSNVQPPITPDLKRKPRLQFLDTGLLNYSLGIQAEMLGVKDLNNLYKGKIIEHLVVQQLEAQHKSPNYKPIFWVREKANSSSEIDIVYHYQKYIIPIEVKSGGQGKLRSLHQFMKRTNHHFAVRLLANNFSVEKIETADGINYFLMNLPYFLSTKIPDYIKWFIANYKF